MRTIAEIKESMTREFMQNEEAAKIWGFEQGAPWESVMGRVSVENVMFYIVALCCYVVEALMDTHKTEVEELIATRTPHRAKWYRDKALAFLDGKDLIEDGDEYDTQGMSVEEVKSLQVVKHAVAVEDVKSGILVIKVAGENDEGKREPLTTEQCDRLKSYLGEVKDAGVRIEIVNALPGLFSLQANVYYDALHDGDIVKTNCKQAIVEYVENLEFNGILSRNGIEDSLRGINGVEMVQLGDVLIDESADAPEGQVYLSPGLSDAEKVYCRPYAGYCQVDSVELNMKVYGQGV